MRLTNITLENLYNNSFKTNNSDIIFFRVKNNNSVSLNENTFYLSDDRYNYDSGFIDIDIFLDWKTMKSILAYNNDIVDSKLNNDELNTAFYHINLSKNQTFPNRIIIYNLYPDTECVIKNLMICEEICDDGK